MAALRILVADDHPIVRDGLRVALAAIADAEVVGEVESGTEAVKAAAELQPDLILMDIVMPGLNGIEATRQVKWRNPAIRVLVLTVVDDDDSVFAAMRAGALGYVLKGTGQADLLRAVEAVRHGEAIFGASIATRILSHLSGTRREPAQAFPELTARERQVLGLLAQGLNNAAIANRLHLAPKTVRNIGSSIVSKLHAGDSRQAMRMAIDAGLDKT